MRECSDLTITDNHNACDAHVARLGAIHGETARQRVLRWTMGTRKRRFEAGDLVHVWPPRRGGCANTHRRAGRLGIFIRYMAKGDSPRQMTKVMLDRSVAFDVTALLLVTPVEKTMG